MAKKAKILSFTKAKDASRKRRSQSSRTTRSSRNETSPRSRRNSSTRNSSRTASVSRSYDAYDSSDFVEDIENEEEFDSSQNRAQSARNDRRKKRTKAKADRMYSRQFAGNDNPASDNAPRAALYKGKMGAKQKKAARMQGSLPRISLPSFSASGLVREKASSIASSTSVSPFSIKVLTAVACLILICTFLYTPAQQYYHSQRENARLTVEYETIESRNNALDVQNDIMVSNAGIEDSVRQRFGYVKDGESLGVVVGLSEEATNTMRDSEKIEANVLSSSVKAPEEWYTPLLDALFGVE